jgi:hypothetical protein
MQSTERDEKKWKKENICIGWRTNKVLSGAEGRGRGVQKRLKRRSRRRWRALMWVGGQTRQTGPKAGIWRGMKGRRGWNPYWADWCLETSM